jgi:uncharacterized protein with ACT and thioredoxin-like domain
MKAIELLAVGMVTVLILGGLILASVSTSELRTVREETGLRPVSLGQVGGGGMTVDIIRFVDGEAGVACWLSMGHREAGLSCLPLGDTLLDGGR